MVKDLVYPTSVEFDDWENMYIAESAYSYGDPAAHAPKPEFRSSALGKSFMGDPDQRKEKVMITLYFKQGCPYCKKVLERLHEEVSADFQVFYKQNDDNEKRAKEIGGKVQFPLLLDEERNVVMFESDDIVRYLRENYGR